MYIPKRLLQKLQRVRSIDTSDSLAANLEKREANLHGDKTRRKKTGDFVFVDAGESRYREMLSYVQYLATSPCATPAKPNQCCCESVPLTLPTRQTQAGQGDKRHLDRGGRWRVAGAL